MSNGVLASLAPVLWLCYASTILTGSRATKVTLIEHEVGAVVRLILRAPEGY